MSATQNIFVYGTLKRGQCRESCWPEVPLQIRPAWVHGCLFDLGPYPALIHGQDRIAGQLWSFRSDQIDLVRKALDRIEVTNQPGIPNEYDRIVVQACLLDGQYESAECYFFSDIRQLTQAYRPISPSLSHKGETYVIWPKSSKWIEDCS